MSTARHQALRAYFFSVVQDLAMRGAIRWQTGQSLESLLLAELSTVLGEMRRDVATVLSEIGAEAVGAGRDLFQSLTMQVIRSAMDFLNPKSRK